MPDRPNILLILSDQHNTHISGFAGDAKARTPNLDRLADDAVRFDAAYCQSPLCVPSRISMLTGQYAHKCKVWANASVLTPDQLTVPRHLSNNGYTTALVGKMHLKGPCWMGGFDYRPYGDLIIERFCFHQPDPPETWDMRWCNHRVGRFPWAGETQIPESLLNDGVVTRESLAFLLEHQDRNPDKPWFLCAGYSRPHFPFTTPGRYFRRAMADAPQLPQLPEGYPEVHPQDSYIAHDFHLPETPLEIQARGLAAYYACVNYMDDCIGELIEGARKAGLLENTYVIYTSDHGEMAGEHGLWSKRSYYEGSTGVPLLISGPGIEGSRRISSPVELVDFYPTFCEIAGVDLPDGLDGESLLPILTASAESRKKRFARSELLAPQDIVSFRMARDDRWKYVEFPQHPPRLFDMINDPDENTDLLQTGADTEAPLDELKAAAADGHTWEEIAAIRQEDLANRPSIPPKLTRSPAQYQLPDGRVVDADNFLYEGLAESG